MGIPRVYSISATSSSAPVASSNGGGLGRDCGIQDNRVSPARHQLRRIYLSRTDFIIHH